MPGNPHECRVNAAQFSKLARNAVTSECDALFALTDTWKRLAAELEADQRLLQVLSELHLSSQPHEALLIALNIHPGLKWPSQKTGQRHLARTLTASWRMHFRSPRSETRPQMLHLYSGVLLAVIAANALPVLLAVAIALNDRTRDH
jgi:hypothetical protein